MLPGEAELVSEWPGLPGEAKSVKRFERSNGLDTELYKNYLYLLDLRQRNNEVVEKKQGRPQLRWEECVNRDMRKAEEEKWREKTNNRKQWKK